MNDKRLIRVDELNEDGQSSCPRDFGGKGRLLPQVRLLSRQAYNGHYESYESYENLNAIFPKSGETGPLRHVLGMNGGQRVYENIDSSRNLTNLHFGFT